VHYLPFLPADAPQRWVYEAQCTGAGSTFSFDIKGGLAEAFACLNRLQVFKLAGCNPPRSTPLVRAP
jgi:methionine-gamma-lyase